MLLYNNGTDVIVAFNRVVANVVGNVTGNVTGNLTGTASNATVLATARNIQISGNVTAANVSFDGSAAVNLDVTAINAAGITSGTLGVARGGTGATTLTAENVIIGNGTSAVKFVAAGTTGNVLTSNGSAWVSQAISAGNYILRAYTSPATWTKPAGLKAVKVTVVGGGAGNGTTSPGTSVSAGGTSSFGPFLSATGGAAYTTPASGAGGSGSGGDINMSGGDSLLYLGGGAGALLCTGPAGGGNVRAGYPFGGGASTNGGGGGGSIEYISAPSIPGPVTVTVGAGSGGAGPAPTAPNRRSGAPGIVVVEEFY
jgi:hypothetical protein